MSDSVRVVTPTELAMGYFVLYRGNRYRREYVVLNETNTGNFLVREPRVPEIPPCHECGVPHLNYEPCYERGEPA